MQFDQIVRRVAQPGDGGDALATDRDAPCLTKSKRPGDAGIVQAHLHKVLCCNGRLHAADVEPEELRSLSLALLTSEC